MIRTLRLTNFKAFEDTGDVELKPITVLAGPNSGGKSSILQSLLLLKQTLETVRPNVQLSLDGRFVQCSSFDELTFGRPALEDCHIGYKITLDTTLPVGDVSVCYPDAPIPEGIDSVPVQSDIAFSFKHSAGEGGESRIFVDHFEVATLLQHASTIRPSMTFSRNVGEEKVQLHDFELPLLYSETKVMRMIGRHFLPGFLLLESVDDEKSGKTRVMHRGRPAIFSYPLNELETELRDNLLYLGPLREAPQRAYIHSGSPSLEIGTRGEYAPQILWLEKDVMVPYLPDLEQAHVEQYMLLEAVRDVFQRLGIGHVIDMSTEKSIMYQVLFGLMDHGNGKHVTIADVGFGVSQLLPIVVMGLRSPLTSLLLFEQPEIHLHPRLQANLADFFLTLALSGKRMVVETHSVHFIDRLRRRIAEDPSDELKDNVSILFVHPPHSGQGATIERLRVDRYGVIENWPPDFLPEVADESAAIFRAGLEKRKKKQ